MSEKFILSKSESPRMFDAIAGRYDFLNWLLSLGQDARWRARLKSLLPKTGHLSLLDLATGTADVLISMVRDNANIARGVGLDPALNMLAIGRAKIGRAGLADRLTLQAGDAQALPFCEGEFDVVTISFGLRNLPDLRLGLLEMYRVTKPGGRVLVLELSQPSNPVLRAGHWLYLNMIVPAVGFCFSGNARAYRYLTQTILDFPYGEQLCNILKQFGFLNVRAYPLMGGVATIYAADK